MYAGGACPNMMSGVGVLSRRTQSQARIKPKQM